MKKVAVLGASGSIGYQTLDILARHQNEFELVSFSVNNNVMKVDAIIDSFPSVRYVSISSGKGIDEFRKRYPNIIFDDSASALENIIEVSNPDIVVNALVGFCGLVPTIKALKLNKILALANKESLVVGGELINDLLDKGYGKLYPIDSEHVAIAKCLFAHDKKDVKSLVLTASGGAFRSLKRNELDNVKPSDALKHPSWHMGAKITIDSATMMNKGFEIMEACYLFRIDEKQIDVLMHDESVIHSLVKFTDGSYLADIGPADMRIPIQYALFEGKRMPNDFTNFSMDDISALHFHKFDAQRFPLVDLARFCLKENGSLPAVLNASNEEAVYAFLSNKIKFLEIEEIVISLVKNHKNVVHPSLDDLIEIDRATREKVKEIVASKEKL